MRRLTIVKQLNERILDHCPFPSLKDKLSKFRSIGLVGNISYDVEDFATYYNVSAVTDWALKNPQAVPGAYIPAFSGSAKRDRLQDIRRRDSFWNYVYHEMKHDTHRFLMELGHMRGCGMQALYAPGMYLNYKYATPYLIKHELRHMASDLFGIGPFSPLEPQISFYEECYNNPLEIIAYRNKPADNFHVMRLESVYDYYRQWQKNRTVDFKYQKALDYLSIQRYGRTFKQALDDRVCAECNAVGFEFTHEINQMDYFLSKRCQECQRKSVYPDIVRKVNV